MVSFLLVLWLGMGFGPDYQTNHKVSFITYHGIKVWEKNPSRIESLNRNSLFLSTRNLSEINCCYWFARILSKLDNFVLFWLIFVDAVTLECTACKTNFVK